MINIESQRILSCPKCKNLRIFTTRQGYNYAMKNNSVCNRCSKKGSVLSKEHKQKISKTRIEKGLSKGKNNPNYQNGYKITGKLNPMYGKYGNQHPSYGHECSKETKEKLSNSVKNRCDLEYRKKLSNLLIGKNKGKIHSDESKLKMRISKLKRLQLLGIGTAEDKGSKEWFEKYNKENNTNYKPKRFLEIGYDADGYDEKLHSWIEYDTPYHKPLNRQQKDLIRQNNIIKYFESINRPLSSFIRIKVNNLEISPTIEHVYGK